VVEKEKHRLCKHTESSRKRLFIEDHRKTYPEGEYGHSEHCRDHFVRTLATRKLKWRCSLGQRTYTWEFRIAEERQET
jgi:hypothetical protein